MFTRDLSWILIGCLFATVTLNFGCAEKTIPDHSPIYYTERGVGKSFTEIGRVTGVAFGYCGTSQGVYNSAILNALDKAKARGADAILLPNSMSSSGAMPDDFKGCRIWPLIILFPNGMGTIDALAIEFNRGALIDPRVQELIDNGHIVFVEPS